MEINNKFTTKTPSQKQILSYILKNREISGADLARLTQQRHSSVAYLLKELERQGLIRVSRLGKLTSKGGKPPKLWEISCDIGYIIGLEINPFEIRITIVNFASEIFYQDIHKYSGYMMDTKFERVTTFIQERIQALQLDYSQIIGISIAVPGLINKKNGHILYYSNKGIIDLNIHEVISKRLNIPTTLINDANAGALGIKWFSNNKEIPDNVVFLLVNKFYYGLGAGLILNNRLYEGDTGTSGEFINDFDRIKKIVTKTQIKFGDNSVQLKHFYGNVGRVRFVIRDEDPEISRFILMLMTDILVEKISSILCFINPGLIVIGGDYALQKNIIGEYLISEVNKLCTTSIPNGLTIPQILFSDNNIYSVSAGATALFTDLIFQ